MRLAKITLIGLAGCLGAALLCFVIFLGKTHIATSTLHATIENQLSAIQSDNLAAAYTYTTPDFQKATSFDNFKNIINHFAPLRNNESVRFDNKEFSNGFAIVTATLTSRGGKEISVKYRLAKIADDWKIQAFVVKQHSETMSTTVTQPIANVTNQNEATPTPAVTTALSLSNTYQNKNQHLSIGYPADWTYIKSSRYVINFKNSNADTPIISLYNIHSPGYHRTVDEFINELTTAMGKETANIITVDQGDVSLPPNSQSINAKYIMYSFTAKDIPQKTLAVVFYNQDNQALYALVYTKPITEFDSDLPVAKAMAASFNYL